MSITVLCSLIFMGLKSVEYWVKFHHQALRLMDYTVVEGHAKQLKKPGTEDNLLDRKGNPIDETGINFEASEISFNTVRAYKPWVQDLLFEAAAKGATITLAAPVKTGLAKNPAPEVLVPAGTALTLDLIEKVKADHLKATANNASLRTDNLREQWDKANAAHKGEKERDYQDKVAVDPTQIEDRLLIENAALVFKVEPAVAFRFKPHDLKETPTDATLRDGTAFKGKLLESPMEFHAVDAIDFRHTVMKAIEKGIDPDVAIKNSWLLKNNPEIAEVWEKHEKALHQLEEEFKKEGRDREPTLKDRYRINWEEMAYYGEHTLDQVQINPKDFACPTITKSLQEQFRGPDYEGVRKGKFPELSVPREQVQFASKFTPAWNTFYAIYFTMTGLHGLHVIGGALVLSYYLFFGRKMYLTNPEWLANRVEIGGLFWHFVDLVWIFLFPILYLM
jgi:hypothetical protein